MNNHKLIQILHTFNKKEWREFSKFVESPYFNTDKHCIRLMEILKKEFAKKDGFQISRSRLEKLFSKNNASDTSLLNVKLSLLTRLAEQFFAHQAFEEKPLLFKHLTLQRLFKRGLNSHFESVYRRNSQLHESPEKVSPEHYFEKHLIQEDLLEHLMRSDKKTFLTHENMQETNESLDIFYILKKIKMFNRMKTVNIAFQKNYDLDSFKYIGLMALLPCYTDHPIVRLYYAKYKLRQTPNSQNFNHLLEAIKEYSSALSPFHVRGFYITAVNYCTIQIRQGEDYHKEVHELYADMEAADLLVGEEWVSLKVFQNALNSALWLGKFDWADYIIEKYKDSIELSIRNDTYNYFRALYAFFKKEFGTAIRYLSQAGSVDYEFSAGIKLFLLKSYYEYDTDYSQHTEQAIRSFKVYFKQSKSFSNEVKKSLINFGSVMSYLYRIKHNEGRATIDSTLKKIEQYELLASKHWLLEKIEELQNRPVRRTLC